MFLLDATGFIFTILQMLNFNTTSQTITFLHVVLIVFLIFTFKLLLVFEILNMDPKILHDLVDIFQNVLYCLNKRKKIVFLKI